MNKLHKFYNAIKKIPRRPKPDKDIMNPIITEERKVEIKSRK